MSTPENPLKIIDISSFDTETANDLLDAAKNNGFMFITGHGFTKKEIESYFALSKQFFDLPTDQKVPYNITDNNVGYSCLNREILDPETQQKGDPKEAFNFGGFYTGRPNHELSPIFEENIDLINNIQRKLHDTAIRMLRLFAKGLKIDEDQGGSNWLSDRHRVGKPSGSILRMLYYPGQKSADPQEVIRAGAHTDYGSLTLLFQQQGQEGLEIFSPITNSWTPVPYIGSEKPEDAPPLVVNIGDQLSYWTAGILHSTIHRVKFPKKSQETGQDRYSMAYFVHPEDNTPLVPVPSDITRGVTGRGANAANEKPLTAKEHLDKRLAATYGWTKEK